MMPAWKLRREAFRLLQQVRNLPKNVASIPSKLSESNRRALHDKNFLDSADVLSGDIPADRKIAVFLLFQPNGICESTLSTCNSLVQSGFAPLIISNCPISDKDIKKLGPKVWRIIQRPNFGYDFGGYRDAIRFLWREEISLDWLIIMNDSVWHTFSKEILEKWMNLAGDLTGLLQDEKVRHTKSGGFATELRHVESYFFLVKGDLWRSSVFRTFWENYRMSDNKAHTIKSGEIGFSRFLLRHGMDVKAVSTRSAFLDMIADQSIDFLTKTLTYGAYDDNALSVESATLRDDPIKTEAWRVKVLDHIRRVVLRRRFNSSFCYANHFIFGTFCLKKSSETIFVEMRSRYLEAMRSNDLPVLDAAIVDEMQEMQLLKARQSKINP